MYSNFGQIGPHTTELVIMVIMVFPLLLVVYSLVEDYSKYFDGYTCWLSGELSLPFGLSHWATCLKIHGCAEKGVYSGRTSVLCHI